MKFIKIIDLLKISPPPLNLWERHVEGKKLIIAFTFNFIIMLKDRVHCHVGDLGSR